MEQLETKVTQKRRMPKARTMILAAALAVGCLLSVAAAANLPARVYNFVTGGQVYVSPDSYYGSVTIDGDTWNAPVKAEDGRLWFEADGQHIDITDIVDENTPYIYERTDPDTGEKGYVIVGGTAESFGWAELFVIDGEISTISGQNFYNIPIKYQDGSEDEFSGLTIEQIVTMTDQDGNDSEIDGSLYGEGYRPWFQAAMDQLGLDW